MAEFTVTPSELKNKATELQKLNAQLKTKIGELEQAESSLSNMWEGESHDAFSAAFKRDKVQMDNFHAAIEKYVTALNQIAARYETAESRNVSTVNTKS